MQQLLNALRKQRNIESPISASVTLAIVLSSPIVAGACYFSFLQIPPNNIDFGMRTIGWSLIAEEALLLVMAIGSFLSKRVARSIMPVVAALAMCVPPFLSLAALYALLPFFLYLVGTISLNLLCLFQWYLLMKGSRRNADA